MNKIKNRTIYFGFIMILGISLFAASEIFGLLDTYWSGMGVGFIVISIIRLTQLHRYKNDDSYAEKMNVQNNDERNRFLAEKARSMTFYYSILIEAIALIILRILKFPEASTIIGYAVCVQLLIYYVSYLWLKKKY
ncbi:hypothetical protein [Sedimentibacter sp. B4]|uniref:hypothetical protein n=1 Tax=Sedimentibacter sp. B4 TaxID=304766 RepID=UPI0002FC2E9E|nr:hypothetical protein [Sedimentibacter sp. B4]